jgi:hypothetical protein
MAYTAVGMQRALDSAIGLPSRWQVAGQQILGATQLPDGRTGRTHEPVGAVPAHYGRGRFPRGSSPGNLEHQACEVAARKLRQPVQHARVADRGQYAGRCG